MPDQSSKVHDKNQSQDPNDSDNLVKQSDGEKSGTGQNYSGGTGSQASDQNLSGSISGPTGSPDSAGRMHSDE